jgi:hypothetical protein
MVHLVLAASIALADAPADPPADAPPAEATEPLGGAPQLGDAFDREAYDEQMRLARIGIGLGVGGAAAAVGGAFVALGDFNAATSATALQAQAGASLIAIGATLFVVGPIVSVAGALSAASKLNKAGHTVTITPGLVGVGLLVGGLLLPVLIPVSYAGSGFQMARNNEALPGSSSLATVAWGFDPTHNVLRISGTF